MKWNITYYNKKVEKQLLAWPDKLLANYLRIIDMIEINGPDLGLPFTRAMGGGLFEIRAKSHYGIGRAFFCILTNKEIIILHSFIKKTEKTPSKELKIAQKRMKEVKI